VNRFFSLFDLTGTASRKQLALALFFAVAATLTFGISKEMQFLPNGERYFAPFSTIAVIWLVSTTVRRLHDIGRTGGWAILLALPFVNLVLIVTLLFAPSNRSKARQPWLGTIVGTTIIAVYLILGLSRVFWTPYWIPAESSKPTLLVGDYLAVRYLDAASARRGDVIVFRHPVNGSDMVKRLIGLPGDKVQVQDGVLYLNGAAAPQTPDGTFEEVFEAQGPMASRPRCANEVVGEGAICQKEAFRETLPGGRSHAILNIEDGGFADNTDVFEVPPGHYFFMGDNRDNSQDSRFSQAVGGVGFVPAENLIGRADRVIFSSAGKRILYFWTWRSDRFFKAVE
jgi:signal peptidase I